MADSRQLNGRSAVYVSYQSVDQTNISEVLDKARAKHQGNASDISYLYDYYRGVQPVLDREKVYNTTICNRVVQNRAKEISDFKTGYLLSSPIQYINAQTSVEPSASDTSQDELGRFVSWMRREDKESSDLEVAFWQSVCGTAFRMLSPKDADELTDSGDADPAPFRIVVLDPRYTFVVYTSDPSHRPIMGVTYVTSDDGTTTYYCYTDTQTFVVSSSGSIVAGTHEMGRVPIIEYPMGPSRMGDFEPVVPLLDAINTVESSRMDGIEQFVQAILKLKGVDPGDMDKFMQVLRETGGIGLPKDGDMDYLKLDMNQTNNQALVDDLYGAVLRICGMPDPHSGYNTSDTGAAVILRDGWSATEAVACRTETWFRRSERSFLDMAIDFCDVAGGLSLAHSDVDIRFPRRNYTNDSANVSNLTAMLNCDWIPPELAYEHSNMFPDPYSAYLKAKAYHDQREDEQVSQVMAETSRDAQQPADQQPTGQGSAGEMNAGVSGDGGTSQR